LAAAVTFGHAFAQAGERALKIIMPGSAGSGGSTMMRAASPALSKALGVPVVVEDQPGAGGIVGTAAMVRSPPDGYTLSLVSNNHVIYPYVYKSLPFDATADITPIAMVASTPMVMVINPKTLPAKNAKEMIALLKANPGKYNYASSGNGTIAHLAAAMFLSQADVKATHVPYKGVGPGLTALIAGEVDFAPNSLTAVRQFVDAGTLRAIGVAGTTRLPNAPNIPTFVEQGMPDYVTEAWYAIVGPAKMLPADVKRINAAVKAAFNSPEVRESLEKSGNQIDVSTPEFAAEFFLKERAKYERLVKIAGVEIQ
jgi:tripartite-type tricarboxylate transporter receptor subunit TctC